MSIEDMLFIILSASDLEQTVFRASKVKIAFMRTRSGVYLGEVIDSRTRRTHGFVDSNPRHVLKLAVKDVKLWQIQLEAAA